MSVTQINKQAEPDLIDIREVPHNGERWAMMTWRYPDGSIRRTGQPIPETYKPYFYIPSAGVISKEELQYLAEGHRHAEDHPSDQKLEFQDKNKKRRESIQKLWRDHCEARVAEHTGRKVFG